MGAAPKKKFRAARIVVGILFAASVAFVAIATASSSCAPIDPLQEVPVMKISRVNGEPPVRVLLANTTGHVTVERVGSSKKEALVFKSRSNKLRINDEKTDMTEHLVEPGPGELLKTGKYACRGSIRIVARGNHVLAINSLPMEEYLAGVLGSEMPLYFHREALRAQAIAARTYCLDRILSGKNDPEYDVVATTCDQVYKGTNNETALSRKIVQSTRGVCLTWNGDIFTTYFHSTCGGRTVPSTYAFSRVKKQIPPLDGTTCGYCQVSKRHTWKKTIPAKDLAEAVPGLDEKEEILEIEPGEIDQYERLKNLIVKTKNETYTLDAINFRKRVGAGKLWSNWITAIDKKPGGFQFHGHGWGHGVGMCQWGAEGMARSGKDAVQILLHYYPGAALTRLYE